MKFDQNTVNTPEGREALKRELERLSKLLDPAGHDDFMRNVAAVENRSKAERDALALLGFPGGRSSAEIALENDTARLRAIITDPNSPPEAVAEARRVLGLN